MEMIGKLFDYLICVVVMSFDACEMSTCRNPLPSLPSRFPFDTSIRHDRVACFWRKCRSSEATFPYGRFELLLCVLQRVNCFELPHHPPKKPPTTSSASIPSATSSHRPHNRILTPTMSSQLDKPGQWATGSEAPTSKQTSFLQTLAASKNADIDPSNMNKSEASKAIDDLKNSETKNPDAEAGAPIQDPKSWATGDDPATGKQMGYIAVMAQKAGEQKPAEGMGKTEASQKIEELKGKTGM